MRNLLYVGMLKMIETRFSVKHSALLHSFNICINVLFCQVTHQIESGM